MSDSNISVTTISKPFTDDGVWEADEAGLET